tara:strand:+ start:3305 stop:3844 length:540 start_codon:yes stop_codon:yes gene_type:complete
MKKLLLTLLSLTLTVNAYAAYPNKTNFEFYYNGNLVETTGKFYITEIVIDHRKDTYQRNMKTPVDTFRNVFTALKLRDRKWLYRHTKGTETTIRKNTEEIFKTFEQGLFHMHGYAKYHNYTIVLLNQKDLKKKVIFPLEKDQYGNYFISANFKYLHPRQYEIMSKAYKGEGELKIVKNK